MVIRCRKQNISLCFLIQSYFSVPKTVGINCTHYIIFKIHNRKELQEIALDHLADINYKDVINIYRNCTKEPFNFLAIDTTQPTNKKVIKNFDESL